MYEKYEDWYFNKKSSCCRESRSYCVQRTAAYS